MIWAIEAITSARVECEPFSVLYYFKKNRKNLQNWFVAAKLLALMQPAQQGIFVWRICRLDFAILQVIFLDKGKYTYTYISYKLLLTYKAHSASKKTAP